MADEAKIKLSVEGAEAPKKAFQDLQTRVKELDYQFRQTKITSGQLKTSLNDVVTEANKLNISYKQNVDLTAQIFQVQRRAAVGFKSLAEQMHEQTQASNRSQQAFVALAYIIQDLPYGIRGVANNITQLSQVLGTPIWINLAISGLTSLAVVFDKTLTNAVSGANAELDRFNTKSSEAGRKFASYGFGLEARAEYQIGGFSQKKLLSERGYTVTQAGFVETQIKYYGGLRDAIKDKADASDEDKKKMEGYQNSVNLLNKQLDAQLAYIKAINAEIEKRGKTSKEVTEARNKISPMEVGYASNGMITKLKDVDDLKKIQQSNPFALIGLPNGQVKFAKDVTFLEFDLSRPLKGVKVDKVDNTFDTGKMQKDALQELTTAYNSMFFDPVKAGFKALSDEISTSLFGTFDAMKEKFGNVGAAILQSLSQVIAKLLETLAITALLNMLFPGSTALAGGFGSVFSSILTGGKYTDVVTGGGGGSQRTINPRSMGNAMIGGSGNKALTVNVVGVMRGKDMYLVNQRYLADMNVIKV